MVSTVVAVFVVVSRPKVNTILSSNRWAVSSWQTTCPHPCSTSDPDSVWFLGLEVCSQSLLLGMLTLIFLSFRKKNTFMRARWKYAILRRECQSRGVAFAYEP